MVKRFFGKFYMAIVMLFLYAPILVLIIFSFNESKTMAKWGGFTFKWYGELFRDPMILEAIWVTISVALLAAVISTVVGTITAIGMQGMRTPFRMAMTNISYLPILNPDIVTGVSMMLLFVFLKIPRGYFTMLLAHITFDIPYVIFSVLPKLRQMRGHTYEAALDLGAKPMYAMRKVVIPEIMPGIVTGFLFAFTLSLDDFVISFFTTQGINNLSIAIYSMARKGISPKINALSALMFVVVIILLLVINLRSLRAQKKEPA